MCLVPLPPWVQTGEGPYKDRAVLAGDAAWRAGPAGSGGPNIDRFVGSVLFYRSDIIFSQLPPIISSNWGENASLPWVIIGLASLVD